MFSDPVVGDDFFGRQEVIDVLTKRASAFKSGYRQNVAIIGHQQLGKTSILRHFLHTFKDSSVLCVYVEIKLQALDYFVEQFIRSLLFQCIGPEAGISPSDSLAKLSETIQNKLPATVARIHEISALLKQRHAEEAYSRLFELTSVITQETGKRCIVILDEFHRLGEFGVKNAFSNFGKRIMVQKDTMYLLSSSSFSASKKILAEKLALLFGNFERIYLEPFDFKTSFNFVASKLSAFKISESLGAFLVSFTDGQPFFLQNTVSKIRDIAAFKNENEVSKRTVAEALLKLLFESQGVFNQYFTNLIQPWARRQNRGSHILILTQLAKGSNRLKDIAQGVNRNQRETSSQLNDLIESELILKNGVFYRFHNKLFKFWLREVYEKRELSLLEVAAKAEDFIARMEQVIDEHEALRRLDPVERVSDLFTRFQNDLIEFGEKKRKLPHFSEIIREEIGALRGSSRKLIAKGHGRCWVCKIVEERATEREVLELLKDETAEKSAATKVLVALNGMDDTAKLLAKEKKVLTLGLSRVNLLMDLYGAEPILETHPS